MENTLTIQWFPGHMTKAMRLMEKEIKLVDTIIYVLDSRAPFSCVNPKFEKLIDGKPIIYVFNKCDMSDMTKVDEWVKFFKKENTRCVTLDSTASGSGKKVESAIKDVLSSKIAKFKAKNMTPTLRAMVIGVPNSGKSTLINLIPRFYDVTSGKILVDGVDVRDYKQSVLHNKIGYVSQKAVMFTGTVESNVDYGDSGKSITEEEIIKAIDVAQGTDFVSKMEDGYTSHIARGGTNVSGGQKQRLSIARAVAKNPEQFDSKSDLTHSNYQNRKKFEWRKDDKLWVEDRKRAIKDLYNSTYNNKKY